MLCGALPGGLIPRCAPAFGQHPNGQGRETCTAVTASAESLLDLGGPFLPDLPIIEARYAPVLSK